MTRSRPAAALTTIALAVGLLVPVAQAPAVSASHQERISGADRYETAARVSASRFGAGVPVAYVVTGKKFPDALTAGVAAGVERGPVLLTQPTTLPTATSVELDRLRPAEIVVVGGTTSVSEAVLAQLERKTSGDVTRVQGGDRFATATAVARHAFAAPTTAYVASGEAFPDALSGVPAAVLRAAPLLLVTRDRLPDATAQYLAEAGVRDVVVLGGPGTVSTEVEDHLRALVGSVSRVAGDDRFATSAAVSRQAFPAGAPVAYLATGQAAADALAAGPVAGLAGGPVLLVRGNCLPPAIEAEVARLRSSGAVRIVILGGDRAVGTAVEDETRCPTWGDRPGNPTVGTRPTTAAWDDDGPDPHIVRFGHQWFAYTTGTTWGNRIGVLRSDRPDGGWRTTTGEAWGSTALASHPDWQVPDTQWAPAVYRHSGRYVMFYAAEDKGRGEWCLSVAVADAPEGPFRDQTAATGPIVCQDHIGGVIDPHPFVDADGQAWLHFKNNDGMTDRDGQSADELAVSKVWAARLSADGTRPVGSFHEVLAKDTSRYPWQTTVDNPQMVLHGGVHYLFHTGGDYVGNATYATGYAVCAGPLGPCPESRQILTSYGDVAGPGGGTVARGADGRWWISYHAWTSGCYDYSCGGERKLYVAPLSF